MHHLSKPVEIYWLFPFLKFTSKNKHLHAINSIHHQNFKPRILPTFGYFCIFLAVNYVKITPNLCLILPIKCKIVLHKKNLKLMDIAR
nr:MAG TPA: hypothetical protein [Caudoviricetes sp.]